MMPVSDDCDKRIVEKRICGGLSSEEFPFSLSVTEYLLSSLFTLLSSDQREREMEWNGRTCSLLLLFSLLLQLLTF